VEPRTGVKASGKEGDGERLEVEGTLRLRGVEKSLKIPLVVTVSNGRLLAAGEVKLQSDQWGVPQISAVGGTVKTKEDLVLDFEIAATPNSP
jgi:polyisoprenoid-binding protein YceI